MRGLAFVWIISAAVSAAVFASLALTRQPDIVLPSVPVVAIGTSLVRHAIPGTGGPENSLLGDGRPHIRLAKNRISEDAALALMRAALQANVQTLLIELYPFCFDFADQPGSDSREQVAPLNWARSVLTAIQSLENTFNIRVLGKMPPDQDLPGMTKPADFVATHAHRSQDLPVLYRLRLRQPNQTKGLTDLLALAKSKGVDLHFLAPPRSALAAQFQGPKAMAAEHDHLSAVANRYGVDLIDLSAAWPNKYFVDQGHLNFAGQTRFLLALKSHWQMHHGS